MASLSSSEYRKTTRPDATFFAGNAWWKVAPTFFPHENSTGGTETTAVIRRERIGVTWPFKVTTNGYNRKVRRGTLSETGALFQDAPGLQVEISCLSFCSPSLVVCDSIARSTCSEPR